MVAYRQAVGAFYMIGIWGKIKGFAAGLGLVLVAIGIAFLKGRKAGVEHVEAEQTKRRIEALQDRKAVDDEIKNLGSNDVDQRLARWMRDNG